MNGNYPFPVLTENGRATHVLVPVEDFEHYFRLEKRANRVTIPQEVAFAVADGMSPLKAWRKRCGITQEELAGRMGISRPSYTQSERDGVKPRQETIRKAAVAMGLAPRQILELFDDEPLSDDGFAMPPDSELD